MGYYMISFENDYLEGAHENVLQRLFDTNLIQASGYGDDQFSKQAAEQIKSVINCPEATVRFLVGGTQTNQVVINSVLEPYEGVISADTGHVAVHEGGAIEFSGHKVLTVPSHEGKIRPKEVNAYLDTFTMILNVNTWSFQEWFIFHTLQNTVLCIVKRIEESC